MSRYNYPYALLLVVLTLLSCTKELDLEIKPSEPEIVLNSILTAGEKARIELSKSAGTGENTSIEVPENAQIWLSEDGQPITDLEEEILTTHTSFPLWRGLFWNGNNRDFDFPYHQTVQTIMKEGSKYEVKVFVPGEDTLHGSATVPQKPHIQLLSVVDSSYTFGNSPDIYHALRIRFRIYDDGIQPNHYLLAAMVGEDENGPFYPTNYYSKDQIILENYLNIELLSGEFETYYNNEEISLDANLPALFSNENFDGGYHDFSISTGLSDLWEDEEGVLFLCLMKLSPDFFEYYRTSFQQREFLTNPFSEPITIHSNVENGLGIIGGMAVDTVWIPW